MNDIQRSKEMPLKWPIGIKRSGPRDDQWTEDEIKAMEALKVPPYTLKDLPSVEILNQRLERINRLGRNFNAT